MGTIDTAQSMSTPSIPATSEAVTDTVIETVTEIVADTVDKEEKQDSAGKDVSFNSKLHDEVINGSDFHCLNKDCSFHAKFKDMIRHVREGMDNYSYKNGDMAISFYSPHPYGYNHLK